MYSTILGGSGTDTGLALALDSAGDAYVAGSTTSADFPVGSPAYQSSLRGLRNAFVAELDPAGAKLLASTYFGGTGDDTATAIAVSGGSLYLAGGTTSADLPTAAGAQPVFGGVRDAFVAKLNASLSSLVYATYVGGAADDARTGTALAVNALGEAFVTTDTTSTNLPVTSGVLQPACAGSNCADALVAHLSAAGSAFLYLTYLGGSAVDIPAAIAVDSAANAYVAGSTASPDFPVKQALQPACAGCSAQTTDGFVAELDPAGAHLVFSTYLGGSDADAVTALALDALGNITIAGSTQSADFPVVAAVQPWLAPPGSSDAFISQLSASGDRLLFSTYFGGSAADSAAALADAAGAVFVAGVTASFDLRQQKPLLDPLGGAVPFGGMSDAFIAKLADAQQGADLAVSVTAPETGVPLNGTVHYTVTVINHGPVTAPAARLKTWFSAGSGTVQSFPALPCQLATTSPVTTCDLGDLTAGASRVFQVNATAATSGALKYTALVDSALADPDATNNVATLTTQVTSSTADFALAVTPASATVAAGTPATYAITLTAISNFSGTVTLACAGAPAESTCTPSANSAALSGSSATASVTINTRAPAYSSWLLKPEGRPSFHPLFAVFALLSAALWLSAQHRRLVLLLLALTLTACSGASNGAAPRLIDPGTPKGTYTLTLTASSGVLSHAQQVTLTVQ